VRNGPGRLAVIACSLLAVTAVGSGVGAASSERARPKVLGPGPVTVRLDIRYSRFTPGRIVVRPGTTVRFEVRNRDPIGHELVVGPPEIHALHEAGTEHVHVGGGEVSTAPGTVGVTAYRFETPGSVVFACHLPGHFAYGMSGEVIVRPA
jgi:uncharacterized cupredoxin-like copper-binding protein